MRKKARIEFSATLSAGHYGGFYIKLGRYFRICLGWIAFTIVPVDIDYVFQLATAYVEEHDPTPYTEEDNEHEETK